jgi:5'-nucleotidase/UDP-sugar diphosphatase
LKLHAGDAMTGTLYHTLYQGEADAALMNSVCFDAFELGNHEFDEGDAGLRRFLDDLRSGPCQTTVLAANVEAAIGSPLAPAAANDYLQPYLLKSFGNVTVGIIGIEVRGKTMNSSRPLPSTRFADEIASAQKYIERLRAQGIRHIILLTHQGYAADVAMAAQLSDVDVIIGGDSHTLLGDFSAIGIDASSGPYPTVVRNRDGDPVCIGQAWEYAKAFGLLQVRFDAQGRVESCRGEVTLPIGDDFRQKDASGAFVAVDAATRARIVQALQESGGARVVTADPLAQATLGRFAGRLEDLKKQQIGIASESLCLVRVPGESTNRSSGVAGCEQANTLARGSDIAQAVAIAYRQASRLADIALQNGGGIRSPLPQGEVSFNTAYTVLPYSNVLFELQLSGSQVAEVLEDAVGNYLDRGGSDGSHPYAAGLRWQLDLSQPRGRRFSAIEVQRKGQRNLAGNRPTRQLYRGDQRLPGDRQRRLYDARQGPSDRPQREHLSQLHANLRRLPAGARHRQPTGRSRLQPPTGDRSRRQGAALREAIRTMKKQYIVGIDLGTSNTVVAYSAPGKRQVELFEIEQLVGPGQVAARPLLPSVRFHPARRRDQPG